MWGTRTARPGYWYRPLVPDFCWEPRPYFSRGVPDFGRASCGRGISLYLRHERATSRRMPPSSARSPGGGVQSTLVFAKSLCVRHEGSSSASQASQPLSAVSSLYGTGGACVPSAMSKPTRCDSNAIHLISSTVIDMPSASFTESVVEKNPFSSTHPPSTAAHTQGTMGPLLH